MTQWRTTECGICSGPAGRGLLSAVLSTLALQGHIGRAGGGPEAGSSHRDHPEPVRVHSRKPGRAGVGSPGPCVDGNERWGLGQLWGWALGMAASSLGDRASPCSLCGHHSGGDGCPCPVHEWPPPSTSVPLQLPQYSCRPALPLWPCSVPVLGKFSWPSAGGWPWAAGAV